MGVGRMADAAAATRSLSLCAPAAQIRDWAAMAAPGDSMIYAQGPSEPRGEPGWIAAGALADSGVVALFSTRRDGCRYWQAKRLASVPAGAGWTPEARLMALIAKRGCVRATNAELAEQLGLRNRDGAAALIRKLKAERLISTMFEADGKRVIVRFGAV
jgi:hypothetical protein